MNLKQENNKYSISKPPPALLKQTFKVFNDKSNDNSDNNS